jgi:hypothetical protein
VYGRLCRCHCFVLAYVVNLNETAYVVDIQGSDALTPSNMHSGHRSQRRWRETRPAKVSRVLSSMYLTIIISCKSTQDPRVWGYARHFADDRSRRLGTLDVIGLKNELESLDATELGGSSGQRSVARIAEGTYNIYSSGLAHTHTDNPTQVYTFRSAVLLISLNRL